jgi:hypothetical protein
MANCRNRLAERAMHDANGEVTDEVLHHYREANALQRKSEEMKNG